MAHVLLVHGSCHGGWCWRDVVPLLTARGHRVTALDLPAHGDDETPRDGATLESYTAAILDAATPGTVLVGHSLGGMWITAAAEADPDRFAHLVYVTAWAPVNGQAARDIRQAANADALKAAMARTPDGLATFFSDEALEPLFYHDCPAGTTAFAKRHLCPEPIEPTTRPLDLTERHLRVPRSFVRCMADRVIPPAHQVIMSRDWPADRVHEIDCGHSPFFSNPDDLARILTATAEAST